MIRATFLSLAGCAETATNSPTLPKAVPVISEGAGGGNLYHFGDRVDFQLPAGVERIDVSLVNQAAVDKTFQVTLSAERLALTLDAETLPGFDEAADLQAFELRIEVPGTTPTDGGIINRRTIEVVKNAEAMAFPSITYQIGGAMPPGKSPWRASVDTAGTDALAARFKEAFKGEGATLSSTVISQDRVVIPPTMGPIPAEIPLREYMLTGTFATYVVPKEYSPTGRSAVLSPKSFRFVISQSEPAQLVSFTIAP